MVSNQKPPGKRKPIVSEGHARKHGRRVCSAPWLSGSDPALTLVSHCPVSVYSGGFSLALTHADGQTINPFPCLSANRTDICNAPHTRFHSHLRCFGGKIASFWVHPSVAVMRIWPGSQAGRTGRPSSCISQRCFPGSSRAELFASVEDLAQYFSSEVWKI